MKILKLKSILFSLLAILIITIFLSSCEKDVVDTIYTDETDINNLQTSSEENNSENSFFIKQKEILSKIEFDVPKDGSVDKENIDKLLQGIVNPQADMFEEYFKLYESLSSYDYVVYSENYKKIEKEKLVLLGYNETEAENLAKQTHSNRLALNELSIKQFKKPYNMVNPEENNIIENKFASNNIESRGICTLKSYPKSAQRKNPKWNVWSSNCKRYYTKTPYGQTDCDKEYRFDNPNYTKVRATMAAPDVAIYLKAKGNNFLMRTTTTRTYVLLGWGNSITASVIKSGLSMY